jgi:uncharacterized protein YdcH (DUF465 family)
MIMSASTTTSTIDSLRNEGNEILKQIAALPVFRRGSVSEHPRSCGKPTCRCRQSPESRHVGYQWTTTIHGQKHHRTIHLGPEVKKYLDETSAYKHFLKLIDQYVQINEQIADHLPLQPVETEEELDTLKKKLRTQLSKQRRKKSGA